MKLQQKGSKRGKAIDVLIRDLSDDLKNNWKQKSKMTQLKQWGDTHFSK